MDINELNKRYEEVNYDIIEASEDESLSPATIAAEKEKRIRRLELAAWAENKGILKGEPKVDRLTKVWARLRKGKPVIKAIRGICSYTTWQKWRKEYPEIAAMEEQCREERIQALQDKILEIADQPDRTRMGETARDRLMIEARLKEIERLDRLTESRMEAATKAAPTVVPIQINVKYGKEDKQNG